MTKRHIIRRVSAAILACAPALGSMPAHSAELAPTSLDGRAAVYRQSHVGGEIDCDGRPIVLAGDHTSLRLRGPCGSVRVAGEHNDIAIETGGGSVVEITGMHNDVTSVRARGGGRPTLLDRGAHNTFHYSDR